MAGNENDELRKANAEAESNKQKSETDDELESKELKEVAGGGATWHRSKSKGR